MKNLFSILIFLMCFSVNAQYYNVTINVNVNVKSSYIRRSSESSGPEYVRGINGLNEYKIDITKSSNFDKQKFELITDNLAIDIYNHIIGPNTYLSESIKRDYYNGSELLFFNKKPIALSDKKYLNTYRGYYIINKSDDSLIKNFIKNNFSFVKLSDTIFNRKVYINLLFYKDSLRDIFIKSDYQFIDSLNSFKPIKKFNSKHDKHSIEYGIIVTKYKFEINKDIKSLEDGHFTIFTKNDRMSFLIMQHVIDIQNKTKEDKIKKVYKLD